MNGRVGDRIVVWGRRVGEANHTGEIVDVAGSGRYLVRWADGRETMVVPGSDAMIEHPTSTEPPRDVEELSVTVDLRINEDRDCCRVKAVMHTASGVFRGFGEARRHPEDPEVPLIGEELAVARALADLAMSLEQAAQDAMASQGTMATADTRSIHLVR